MVYCCRKWCKIAKKKKKKKLVSCTQCYWLHFIKNINYIHSIELYFERLCAIVLMLNLVHYNEDNILVQYFTQAPFSPSDGLIFKAHLRFTSKVVSGFFWRSFVCTAFPFPQSGCCEVKRERPDGVAFSKKCGITGASWWGDGSVIVPAVWIG